MQLTWLPLFLAPVHNAVALVVVQWSESSRVNVETALVPCFVCLFIGLATQAC